jgi:hypothetical protein
MKKSRKVLYKAKHYVVNCEYNNGADIRRGGPDMLGFDFYIDADLSVIKVTNWLIKALKEAGHNYIGTGTLGIRKVQKKDLWTQKKIWECMHDIRF